MASSSDVSSTAVERTLLILEAAAQREGGMSNADFSRKLKIPKSSASYILRTLEQHGYLRRDGDDGRYRLGMKVLNLSRAALGGIDVREVALPIMRHLVDRIHITTHLAILDHGGSGLRGKGRSAEFYQDEYLDWPPHGSTFHRCG